MREIRVFAPCKLNLYLDVLEKRSDGFHNIETIFEKIDLKDEIIIKEKGKGLRVKTDISACGQGRSNIVYKAARALFKETGCRLNLDIEIIKRVPVAAGLGGGSSDAASALLAINEIFQLGLSGNKLFSIGRDIGKDVPFFLLGASFAAGRGAGELLEAIPVKQDLFHILIKPSIKLSTRLMYNRIDRLGLNGPERSMSSAINSLKEMDIKGIEKNYYNAFEAALAGYKAHIKRAKVLLESGGAKASLLSGSGPTVFCTFKDREEAERVFGKIQKNKNTEVFVAKTYR